MGTTVWEGPGLAFPFGAGAPFQPGLPPRTFPFERDLVPFRTGVGKGSNRNRGKGTLSNVAWEAMAAEAHAHERMEDAEDLQKEVVAMASALASPRGGDAAARTAWKESWPLLAHVGGRLATAVANALEAGSCGPEDATWINQCHVAAQRAMAAMAADGAAPPRVDTEAARRGGARGEQRAFANREAARDALLRLVAAALGSDPFDAEARGTRGAMRDGAKQFLATVAGENFPWLARFLTNRIIEAGVTGEADPTVSTLTKDDPAKLQRLAQRLGGGSSGPSTSAHAGLQPGPVDKLCNGDRADMRSRNGSPGISYASATQKSRGTIPLGQRGAQAMDREGTLHTSSAWEGGTPAWGGSCSASSGSNVQIQGSNLTRGRPPRRLIPSSAGPGNPMQPPAINRAIAQNIQSLPRAMGVYAEFLDAADSARLNLLLKREMTAKLLELNSSTGAAASAFSERVLASCTLAFFLGLMSHSGSYEAGMYDTLLAVTCVDLCQALNQAWQDQSLVLTVPWVVEFLRPLMNDPTAVHSPVIRATLLKLKALRRVPQLQAKHAAFNLNRMCVRAVLDGFVHSFGPLFPDDESAHEVDVEKLFKSNLKGIKHIDGEDGLVNERLLQHCCPLFDQCRMLLSQGASSLAGTPRTSPKLVQVQRIDVSPQTPGRLRVAPISSSPSHNTLLSTLEKSFLESNPSVRRVVDFVVDTASRNIVASALEGAAPFWKDAYFRMLQATVEHEKAVQEGAETVETIVENNDMRSELPMALQASIECAIQKTTRCCMDQVEAMLQAAANQIDCPLVALLPTDVGEQSQKIALDIAKRSVLLTARHRLQANLSFAIRKSLTEEAARHFFKRSIVQSPAKASTTQESQDARLLHMNMQDMSVSQQAGADRAHESDCVPLPNHGASLSHLSQTCPLALQEANRLLAVALDVDFMYAESKLQACKHNAHLFMWGIICGERGSTFFAAHKVALPIWKELTSSGHVHDGEVASSIVDALFVRGRSICWERTEFLQETWLTDLFRPYLDCNLLDPPLLEEPTLLLLRDLWEKIETETVDPGHGQEKLCTSLLAFCRHWFSDPDHAEPERFGLFQLPSLLLGWSAQLGTNFSHVHDRVRTFVDGLDWAIA